MCLTNIIQVKDTTLAMCIVAFQLSSCFPFDELYRKSFQQAGKSNQTSMLPKKVKMPFSQK